MRKLYTALTVIPAIFILSNVRVGSPGVENPRETTISIKDSIPRKNKKDPIAEDIKRLMLPVPPSFSPADSAQLIANWTIGIKFYKANCAKCHGIFGKGRDSIPNFSKEQMDNYKTNFLAGDKLNHAVMSKMTEYELNAVFLFITNIRR